MYQIPLIKEKVKRNQVVAFHMIAAIILVVMGFITFITPFSLNIYQAGQNDTQFIEMTWVHYMGLLISIIGLGIIILTIFFNKKIIQKNKNVLVRIIEIVCFLPILVYCILNEWYLPAAYSGAALLGILFALYLEKKQESNRIIEINDKGIQLKTSSKDTIWKWYQLEHFVIKHNVITLRTTDKKLYQFISEQKQINEDQMIIQYAQKNIENNIPNRQNNDW